MVNHEPIINLETLLTVNCVNTKLSVYLNNCKAGIACERKYSLPFRRKF